MAATLEIAIFFVDSFLDFIIKLFLLLTLSFYSWLALTRMDKVDIDYLSWDLIKLICKISSLIWFITLPLWLMFLLRSPIDVLYLPLLGFYGLFIVLVGTFIYVGGFEFGARLLGLKLLPSRLKGKKFKYNKE